MKTLCFSLGLLLFVCCSDAMPTGIHHSTGPEKCCFGFSENPVPLKRVTAIIKTHHSCQHEAFVVETRKRKICVSKTSIWVQNLLHRVHNLENIIFI
uniref:Chemokine interleukin-8-like domain-containing protein n=1 Tax=Oryzias latipes TaxID=8090 RepID=A0A3P9IT86_ORYLA